MKVLGHQLGKVELQALRPHIGHVDPRHRVRPLMTVTQVVLTGITGTVLLPMRWSPSDADLARAADLIGHLGLTRIAGDR